MEQRVLTNNDRGICRAWNDRIGRGIICIADGISSQDLNGQIN